ncbi:MAG: alpha-amylase family glycosyl hydrolase [Vulcanimicrobiota bacterium]
MNSDSIKSKYNLIGVMSSAPMVKGKKAGNKPEAANVSEPREKVSINTGLFKAVVPKKQKSSRESHSESLKNDVNQLKDGYDTSRDITGVHAKEGRPSEPYKFRVDLTRLRPGAEYGKVDVYTLISMGDKPGKHSLPDNIEGSTTRGWNLALGTYDNENFKAVDDKGKTMPNAITGVKFNSLYSSVEFSVNKNVLREKGWKDGQPLNLQVFTAKDRHPQITDSMDDFRKKPWDNQGKLTRVIDTSRPDYIPSRDNNWKDDIVYFILTDRFEDGDKTNNMDVQKGDLTKYQGGDLKGITDKLDYLKERGVSTVWVSPVTEGQTEFVNSTGYHGYWPMDFFNVDPHQGDMKQFGEMVDQAHKRDMKVILDLPLNHTAWEHRFRSDPDKKDWYHSIGDIKDWNDPYQLENGSMYGLPDLAQENPKVYDYLMDVSKFWIKEGKVDGFRLDAMMHIPRSFWQKYQADIKKVAGPDFMMVGEVFHGDPAKLAQYQTDGIQSLFDLSLYFTTKDVFAKDGSMKQLAGRLQETEEKYENPSEMMAILDNHDTDRFITLAGPNGKEKMKLALGFLMSINRIPCLYYGTEAAMEGHSEHMGMHPPENRAMMQFNGDPDMQKYLDKLAHARNNSDALKNGSLLEMWKDDQVFSYSRITRDDEALVILNNSYSDQYREIPLREESHTENGTVLKDVLTGQKITVQDKKIKVKMGRKQPLILVKDN